LTDILHNAGARAHELASRNGFWDGDKTDPTFLASKICLMHQELSELLEAVRKDPNAPCEKVPELTVEQEEVADLFLRLVDYCHARGIDLKTAAQLKHKFNESRPYKHGKRI
jgi:NTP pyrophosphatase (non-canonical NTP hydrolase)